MNEDEKIANSVKTLADVFARAFSNNSDSIQNPGAALQNAIDAFPLTSTGGRKTSRKLHRKVKNKQTKKR